ncbi:MAG: hypothetical protein FD132_1994 [bacterium]|nr:MAG: hypothetical protein FD132_1994 [bacterium]
MARLENQIAAFSEGASCAPQKIVAPHKSEPKPTKAKAQFALSEDALRFGRLKPVGTRG